MLLNPSLKRVATKEVGLFFSSPVAYLFLAAFMAVTLFIFFWGEAFFSRNISDVRPLFEWMPLLLIFLSSTLTMRMWSEERRSGTIEHVQTQPLPLWYFVLGKFMGCLVLMLLALLMTLPLPITVSVLGDLDWGPVFAGYLATFLLGATYLSIGLFISSRTDNQIVSLICSVALCGLFYLLGAKMITDFFGHQMGEWLRLLGTGSRFESITRGVLDFRDLYYYISLIAVFIVLCTFSLERERWSKTGNKDHHGRWQSVTALVIVNALVANVWLSQVQLLRWDVTEGKQYSISDATEQYLDQLQEPLLIRGYFSGKTHPLLAPLVPQIRDLIREYSVLGNGRVNVEFIDPMASPELEEEANEKYGIKPVPFQVADRYQAAVVNSYFNVLVQYGDEHQVLGFNDLIEVKTRPQMDVDVQLRNPEHDLTRAVKKVIQSYQASGNLFDTVDGEITFTLYSSSDNALPKQLVDFKSIVRTELNQWEQQSNNRFKVEEVDPQSNGGQVADDIAKNYGFQPMRANLFSNETFYFYMMLEKGDQLVQIPLEDMQQSSFERNLKSGIQRFAKGFTKTVGLVLPPPPIPMHSHGMMMPNQNGPQFNHLEQFLSAELNVQRVDISSGNVSGDVDILLVLSPKNLDEKQLFAIDQFLMQGGTAILATSPYTASMTRSSLTLDNVTSGLGPWLAHHGIDIQNSLVMDSQSAAFPVPVMRRAGGFQVQEMHMLDYPYFVDVRESGLNQDNPMTSSLQQATFSWASPIKVNFEKQKERQVTELIHSSNASWLSSSTDIAPKIDQNGRSLYQEGSQQESHLLAVMTQGRFESFFTDKESPLLDQEDDNTSDEPTEEANESNKEAEEKGSIVSSVINHSADSARLIVFSSNDFLNDQVIQTSGAAAGSSYLNTVQLIHNAIDWSLGDQALMSIRSRGQFNRTLPPLENDSRLFWEYLNYGLAVFVLFSIGIIQRFRHRAKLRFYQQQLDLA